MGHPFEAIAMRFHTAVLSAALTALLVGCSSSVSGPMPSAELPGTLSLANDFGKNPAWAPQPSAVFLPGKDGYTQAPQRLRVQDLSAAMHHQPFLLVVSKDMRDPSRDHWQTSGINMTAQFWAEKKPLAQGLPIVAWEMFAEGPRNENDQTDVVANTAAALAHPVQPFNIQHAPDPSLSDVRALGYTEQVEHPSSPFVIVLADGVPAGCCTLVHGDIRKDPDTAQALTMGPGTLLVDKDGYVRAVVPGQPSVFNIQNKLVPAIEALVGKK